MPLTMTPLGRGIGTCRRRRGFTLVELLIVIVLLGLVGGALLQAIVRQQRFYRGATEIMDTRSQIRQGIHVLPSELRALSTVGGDVVAMTDTSIMIRSTIGTGVVCAVAVGAVVLPPRNLVSGASLTTWLYTPQAGDSIVFYDEGPDPMVLSDGDGWVGTDLTGVPTATAGGCPVGSGFTTVNDSDVSWTVPVAAVPPRVAVGTPVRILRIVRYSLYRAGDGDWYLGYAQCATPASCDPIQPVSGPYRPYSTNVDSTGLRLTYFDVNGAATAMPAAVARIDLVIRGETESPVTMTQKSPEPYRDELRFSVAVRNRS